jgi:glycosyltransferase involved in cell wall biosynthesis
MRITYLHQYFNTPSMPGGTRSYEMARRLVAMGHEVNMVTSWREPDGRKDWFTTEEAGIKVHWLPVPYSNHMSYNQRIASFFKFAWGAARKAASLPADVVFATSTPLTIALPGGYAARRQKVPMVFEVRDLWPEVPIELKALRNPLLVMAARRLERWAYQNSTEVVALAPGMKEGVVATGVSEHLVSVIPNGADFDQSSCVSESESDQLRRDHYWLGSNPLLVYAGAFGHVNDLDFMLALAEELKDKSPEIRFVAIGDGARFAEIEERAREKGTLNNNVFLLGKMNKKDVFRWLSAADAHLVFYKGPKAVWKDCVSNKLFDAMASGKPIISNIPGWGPLLAQEFGAGIILDSDNVQESADVLCRCLLNKTWLTQAGKKSRELAEERFSRDKLAAQLEQVLLRAVANHSN